MLILSFDEAPKSDRRGAAWGNPTARAYKVRSDSIEVQDWPRSRRRKPHTAISDFVEKLDL